MKKTPNLTKSSDLVNKLNALSLPPSERLEAVAAIKVADKVAAVIFSAVAGLKQLGAWLNPHPKFRHE